MKKSIYCILISLFIIGCNRAGELWNNPNDNPEDENSTLTRSSLEQFSSDPYRLEAMQQAVNEVCESKGVASFVLKATDKYVKLKPDSLEMIKLNSAGVIVYPHRLEVKVIEGESEEEGMMIPGEFNETDWRYCVVPVDYQFNADTEYELMYDVFLRPEIQAAKSSANPQLTDELYKEVLLRSLANTGNLDSAASRRDFTVSWSPSARIVFEVGFGKSASFMRYMPAIGMKVVARSYTNTLGVAYTNKDGETGPICTTSVPVSYDVVCVNSGWQIRNGESSVIMSFTTEEQRMTPLYINAANGTVLNVFAAVTRALYAYQQEDYPLTAGLSKQYQNLVVGVCNDDFGKWCNNTYSGRFIPQLSVPLLVYASNGDGTEKSARDVMEIIFHELGHVSHNIIEEFNYIFRGHQKDGESWAGGVCYAYMASYFGDDYVSGEGSSDYTNLVECLMKNGFTLSIVQDGFSRSNNWATWQTRMVSRVNSSTVEADLVNLIFQRPNVLKFNLHRQFKFAHPIVCKNELAFITFNDGVSEDVVKIGNLRSLNAGMTEIIPTDFPRDSCKVVQMKNSGTNRVEVYSELTNRWYPLSITVRNEDIFRPLPKKIVTNQQLSVDIYDELDDKNLIVGDWQPMKFVIDNLNYCNAVFRFTTPGRYIVKALVNYNNPVSFPYTHELVVDVEDFDIDHDLFQIISPPDIFMPDVVYSAKVFPGYVISNITQINLYNNNNYGFPHFTTWNFDPASQILEFSIPRNQHELFDYTLRIFGCGPKGYTDLLVSNFR